MAGNLPTAGDLPTAVEQPQIDTEVMWLHGLFFWMALAVIGATFLLRSEGQESVFFPGAKQAMPELCASKRIFDLPCPGCGLTRSFISISHGPLARNAVLADSQTWLQRSTTLRSLNSHRDRDRLVAPLAGSCAAIVLNSTVIWIR